ncbi:MAG: glycoside hydrolase family 3 C-terminal domain-containing protein [Haliscomenobacter sp.]|nr:glycoside hydrolase family 3 C-terminal domain-containing protein [Haliscomenobacter sp.]
MNPCWVAISPFAPICLFVLLLSCPLTARAQTSPLYKNKNLPVETRVQDLLRQMTPEEKFWQLFMIPGDLDKADTAQYKNGLFGFQVSAGSRGDAGGQMLQYHTNEPAAALAKKINAIQRYFVENTRLGIPIIPFDEALHGVVREGGSAFPQSIALAATWDTALMTRVAGAIAIETRQRGIRQILSPVVNIASDVRWGRTEETYGEDPFLASAMGVCFVKAFETRGIITTPKHFVANVGDGGRDSYPIHHNERLLEEVYFPPFKACIDQGGSRSVMTAYNSLDGVAASSNHWLLTEKLKKQWGFTGFVISDANAVGGALVLHNTAKDYAESGLHAITGGLDVIFQTDYQHHALFIPPFLDGSMDSNRLNDAVARVLRAKLELGLFENPYISETIQPDSSHKQIARQAALESFVLLKNARLPGQENNALPFPETIRRIAVIGPDAVEARLGGYSGPGNGNVSILEGLKQRAGKAIEVLYTPGCGRSSEELVPVPAAYLQTDQAEGLQAAYFNNIALTGEPFLKRIDKKVDFRWTLYGPAAGMDPGFYAVRWTGKLIAPVTGIHKIGLEGNDGFRLYIDNQLVIDNWEKQSYRRVLIDFALEKGRQYDLHIEFYEPRGNATIKLVWDVGADTSWRKKITDAVATAKQADIAVIAAGITEGEFQDRALLSLPGHQEELIQAVAATGKPVVVLLVGGSAITMESWKDKVQAIGAVWYPGEEGGHAIAAVLFGDYNPAGRLPITYPLHEGQLPLVYNHKPTGRGDDYNNLSGLPLFPFGFGLSYTRFAYSDMKLDKNTIGAAGSTTVSFTIKNTGARDGEEVVQLYIQDVLASVARPVLELKGFQRVRLKAGETKTVAFSITPDMLSMLDLQLNRVVEPGAFRVMVGGSSVDIRLKDTLTVH